MKFCQQKSFKTALQIAVEKGNIKIVQLLLSSPKIDVNFMNVFIIFIEYGFYFE